MIKGPLYIDLETTERRNVPASWAKDMADTRIEVVRLVEEGDIKKVRMAGWCVYNYSLDQSPEIEIICGGENTKMPEAAAIWRQGNLLHFGFEPSPDQYNSVGCALLVNAVAYIARFKEDRPIAVTPSIWSGHRALPRRDSIAAALKRKPASARSRFGEAVRRTMPDGNGEVLLAWYSSHRGFMRPDGKGLLELDEDLQALKVPSDDLRFFEVTIGCLERRSLDAIRARRALARYAPGGPEEKASGNAWRRWWNENRPYLFFNDAGGFRWYVDPLAKRRGVPTGKLRGPARASVAVSSGG